MIRGKIKKIMKHKKTTYIRKIRALMRECPVINILWGFSARKTWVLSPHSCWTATTSPSWRKQTSRLTPVGFHSSQCQTSLTLMGRMISTLSPGWETLTRLAPEIMRVWQMMIRMSTMRHKLRLRPEQIMMVRSSMIQDFSMETTRKCQHSQFLMDAFQIVLISLVRRARWWHHRNNSFSCLSPSGCLMAAQILICSTLTKMKISSLRIRTKQVSLL